MKTSVYLENPEVKAYIKKLGASHDADLSSVFVRANNEFNLPHDDLAEAMYIAIEAGVSPENKETLLAHSEEKLLKQAYYDGEIGIEYLKTWMTDEEIEHYVAQKDEEKAEAEG